MCDLPKKGIYRHFKGNEYRLEDFARDSETGDILVIYRALYGERQLWARPLSMWEEPVDKEGVHYDHRFTFIRE